MEPSQEILSTTNLRPVIFSEGDKLKINPLNDPNNPLFYKVLEARFSFDPKGEAFYLPKEESINDFLKKIAGVFEGMVREENLEIVSFARHSPLELIKDIFSRNNFFSLEKQEKDASGLIELKNKNISLGLEDSNLLVIIDKFFGGKEEIPPEEQESFYQILREYFTGKKGNLDLQALGINDKYFYASLREDLINRTPDELIKDPRMLIILNYSFFAYRDWIIKRRLRAQQIKKPEKPHETPLTERIKKARNEKTLEFYQRIKGVNISSLPDDYLKKLLNELKNLGFSDVKKLEEYLRSEGLLPEEK